MRRSALHHPTVSGRLPVLLLVAVSATACVPDGPTGVGSPSPVVSVELSPEAAVLTVDDRLQLEATVRDEEGNSVPEESLSWASSDPDVATVDERGEVTGVGSGSATITASSNGANGSASIEVIEIEIDPPEAEIDEPDDGDTFKEGRRITFEGEGEDPEDGTLKGDALVWTSSLDGKFGTGEEVKTRELSAGTHTITLTVTNSRGIAATDEIEIWIR